jgi:hypothetical protein
MIRASQRRAPTRREHYVAGNIEDGCTEEKQPAPSPKTPDRQTEVFVHLQRSEADG